MTRDDIQRATEKAVDSILPSEPVENTPSTTEPVTVTDSPSTTETPVDDSSNELDSLMGDDFKFSDEKEENGEKKDENPVKEGSEAKPGETAKPTEKSGDQEDKKETDWSKLPPKEVEAAFLRTERGKRILEQFKGMRELAAPPSADGKGGLGFIPTVQQIKEFYQDSNGFNAMLNDWESADPNVQKDVLSAFFTVQQVGEDANGNPVFKPSQQALSGLQAFTEALHPTLYEIHAKNIFKDFIQDLVQRVADPNLPEGDKKYFRGLAQALEDDIFGKRELTLSQEEIAKDPLYKDRQLLKQEKEQIENSRTRQAKAQEEKVVSYISGGTRKATSFIEEAQATFLDSYKGDEIATQGAKTLFISQVKDQMNLLVNLKSQYQNAVQKAKRSMQKADADSAIASYNNWVKQSIRNVLPQFRSKAAQRKVAQSDQVHSAASTSVSASASPASQSSAGIAPPRPPRREGESHREYTARLMNSIS